MAWNVVCRSLEDGGSYLILYSAEERNSGNENVQESTLNQWFLNESVRVYARKVNHDGHLHILEERYHRLNNLRRQSKYNTSNGTVLKHRLMLLFGSFSLSSIYCWDSELLTKKNLKCLILMKEEEVGGGCHNCCKPTLPHLCLTVEEHRGKVCPF